MTIDVHPGAPTSPAIALSPEALTGLDDRAFYRHVGDINSAHDAAEAAYRVAQENLTVLLTEQVARHILRTHDAAAMVFVRVAAEYHANQNGDRSATCEGHNHRLVPFEVMDADGVVLGGFDPLSPVMYLMERLTPMLGVEDQILDIETREWALDCTND